MSWVQRDVQSMDCEQSHSAELSCTVRPEIHPGRGPWSSLVTLVRMGFAACWWQQAVFVGFRAAQLEGTEVAAVDKSHSWPERQRGECSRRASVAGSHAAGL